MQFGRLEGEPTFHGLPADDASVLQRAHTGAICHVHTGLPVWAKKELLGKLYPERARPQEFLRHYAQKLDAVELNATHYMTPKPEQIATWCREVPESFRFCPKIPQRVSHARAPDVAGLLEFARVTDQFGVRLGPALLQFPDYAGTSFRRHVYEYTQAYPHKLAVELRHPEWFSDAPRFRRLVEYLSGKGIALVLTDAMGRPDVLSMAVTSNFVMVRFLGNALHPTDFQRLDAWHARFAAWGERGVDDAYLFLHQPNEVDCVELLQHVRTRQAIRS